MVPIDVKHESVNGGGAGIRSLLRKPLKMEGLLSHSIPCVEQCKDYWRSRLEAMRMEGVDVAEQCSAIEEGVKIMPVKEPPEIRFANTKALRKNEAFAIERLKEYESISAIERLQCEPSIVQPLHIVLKDDRKPRLVLDLSRNLNDCLDLK